MVAPRDKSLSSLKVSEAGEEGKNRFAHGVMPELQRTLSGIGGIRWPE
jgi:hypothetical protein